MQIPLPPFFPFPILSFHILSCLLIGENNQS
jgi:hypothetical protein